MGWYTGLTLVGVFIYKNGYHVIKRMGLMMRENIIGGEIIYSIIDEEW
jgi:hypothetical protein